MPNAKIIIYDPNETNPYGREVASLFAEDERGFGVSIWRPRSTEDAQLTFREHKSLAESHLKSRNRVIATVRRFVGPLRVVAASRGAFLVVCWTRDPWDTFLFGLRARLGGKTSVVYHNPRQLRMRGGLTGKVEQWMLRASTVLVHTERQRLAVADDFPKARVVRHPPYSTLASLRPEVAQAKPGVFAFVGQIREDKGSDVLPHLAGFARKTWAIRFIGGGAIDASLDSSIRAGGVRVENRSEDFAPNDEGLVASLSQCTGLLAPYTSPTTSGTMMLAASLNLPIWTFKAVPTDGIADELVHAASDVEELARMLDDASLAAPTSRSQSSALIRWREDAASSWIAAVCGGAPRWEPAE